MNRSITKEQIILHRLRAQGLRPDAREPARDPGAAVRRVLGVQAQELPAGLLSIRARSSGLTAVQAENARQDAALAWTWAMRGTLHLLVGEDARWLVPLLGPRFAARDRQRMAQLGWDEKTTDRGLRLLEETLEKKGELTRPEITHLLEEHRLPHEGQAPIHLIARAALDGVLIRGPQRGRETAFVLFETWLGPHQPLSETAGLERLARRYLEGYAPAGPKDLAAWAGISVGEARAAGQRIGDDLHTLSAGEEELWMLSSQVHWLDEPEPGAPVVNLLPRFDTYLLGYATRDLGVGPAEMKRVYPGGGILHPVLLVNGQALGTWRTHPGKELEVQVEPFQPLTEHLLPYFEAEAADIGRFLGQEARLSILQ